MPGIPMETPKRNRQDASSLSTLDEDEEFDFTKLPIRQPRSLNIERQRSCDDKSLCEMNHLTINILSPDLLSRTLTALRPLTIWTQREAWDALRQSLVYFRGLPVGTIAALDHSEEALNYNQEPERVKNFLLKTLRLQSWEKTIDRFKLGEGVMPASFKVLHDATRDSETLIADFGESAIGRVASVDSGFWWIILLRAYTKSTGDTSLADMPESQRGMRLILSLCLSEGFDAFPTLLCADGCCMIDRRMGVYGYPIEIQALFFMALRCALTFLKQDDEGKEFVERIVKRLHALSYHMRSYFWLDFQQLNDIYRYKTEEYSHTAVNKFNVIPDSLPDWVFDYMPTRGGYFIGNVSLARMDFRWFCLGDCIAILSSLATPDHYGSD
ncbi:Alkaline/neutral invertase CINV2 [Acorus calamus]|uniref:Alkaline/neutral invertase n=1 Tax=Acorus calamus TaxID=4465 RepID=A0AAV9FP80_ACOCL|nr:Alkaline/neutral invertase CINV2 [Acorus calamus]